jgi:uncharacterized protein YkwD
MKKIIALVSALFLCHLLAFCQINREKVLDEINGWRSDNCFCGNVKKRPAGELIWDKKLEEIAQEYADELAEENKKNEDDFLYLSHVGTDGSTVKIRLEEKEYSAVYCVENIAHLKGNESMVIDHWMNNPTACNNIMNRQVTAMGMARSGDFWVLLVAHPKKK